MANSEWVRVGQQKVKLSNLDKILYPESHFSKAEIIEYYYKIAPTLLSHVYGRPLTLIRYPDGIADKPFFQKNTPEWAPDWIETVSLGQEEKKDYPLLSGKEILIWLANLAALELHQMPVRSPHFDRPDYMVFDLDPPEGSNFQRVIDTAYGLKEHIEVYGYHPFVKTTGGKGLHLVMPIEPKYSWDAVLEAARDMAEPYVNEHNDEATLQLKKKARKGRIFVDIYRNRTHQTIVAPYSLRGRTGGPVSMPLQWDELAAIEQSSHYHLKNVLEKVQADGDAWKDIGDSATTLHIQGRQDDNSTRKEPSHSEHHHSEAQLEAYRSKRDFSKTAEPDVDVVEGEGNRFVVQRHHATQLHYDLRLERDGVLKSWAVPKGLPPRPGVKRLAVETEDHPLEYLTFEGKIPKEEYGGGTMWVYALGNYEILKEKDNSLHFRLESSALSGRYYMYQTEKDQWLLEKEEEPPVDWLNDPIEPMNAKRVSEPPEGDYSYEVKWDGIRALIGLEGGRIRIRTRNQNDVTDRFPELQTPEGLRATCGLFDAEIVYLDEEGKPEFQKIINRLKTSSSDAIKRRSKTQPAHAYFFDCLYLDGRPLVDEPLSRRYQWLQDVIRPGHQYRLSEFMEDGEGLFKAAKEHHLEGIMAKKKDSLYLAGQRSDLWLKVKVQQTADCFVIGYTGGSGDRSEYFGALHLADKKEGELKYRGKVGTGFDQSTLKEMYDELQDLEETSKPVEHEIRDKKDTTWVAPRLVVEVTYSSVTEDGLFREAVFARLRPDLSER